MPALDRVLEDMGRALCFVLSMAVLAGCAGLVVERTSVPTAADVPPRIEALVDLGALAPPSTGSLPLDERDGRFTPGEWCAVLGAGLARRDARVSIGGQAVAVEGLLRGGLLVRMPRGLSPRTMQRLRVETPAGAATQSFAYTSHVVVSDVSGDTLRFLPMGPRAERLFEEPYDLALTRVRAHAFSDDGGTVYAVQAHAAHYALAVVHVGAADHPELVSRLSLALRGVPRQLAMVPAQGRLLLLTGAELVLFDVRSAPRELARAPLPAEGEPWSLALLGRGTHAAVLGRAQNLVWLFALGAGAPELVQTLSLPPQGVPRASLALSADPTDATQLWVLQGRSLARLSGRTRGLVGRATDQLVRARAAVGLGGAPVDDRPPAEPEPPTTPSRLVGLRLGVALTVERELSLPADFLPLFVRSGRDGRLLVSGLTSEAARLESFDDGRAGLSALGGWLRGTTQFGRVVAVDPRGSRATETLVQGMALFFDVDQLPGGELVCSMMRLGVHLTGAGVDWRIEVPHVDAVRIRTLSWTLLLPPYVSPPLGVQ